MSDGTPIGSAGKGIGRRAATMLAFAWSRLRNAASDAAEQRRVFALLPVAMILGLIGYRILPFEPERPFLAAGTISIAALLAWTLRTGVASIVARLAVLTWIGFLALPVHGALFGTPMLDAPRYGTYTARIDATIFDDGETRRWIVSEISTPIARNEPGVRRARLTLSEDALAHVGDIFTARIRFYPVPGPALPGGFDSQFVGYFDGIGAYGTILGDLEIVEAGETDFTQLVQAVRDHIGARIIGILGERTGGVAVALITGDQSRLSEEDRNVMATAGLAHILAISGLHLTLVAGTMYVLLRALLALPYRLPQHFPIKKLAAAGGILTALAYLIISGMGISAIRATIMLTLVFGAVVAGRQALTMRNVALAALVIALVDPAAVFRASFQLSFAAVVALIAAFELARERRDGRTGPSNKLLRLFIDIGVTSIIAGLATLIFTAYHFQQTAPFGLLGNLMAMPVVTFLMMPAALFATLAIPLGLDAPLFLVMGWGIEAVLWCAHFVQTVSGGFDPSPILTPWALVAALLALGWLAYFQSTIRLVAPMLVFPVVMIFCTEYAPDILVADGTQAFAVRHNGELALVAGRTNTFSTNVWSERYMEPIGSRHETTRCDGLGCVLVTDMGFSVALVRDPAAFREDCARTHLVLTRNRSPVWCADLGAQIIDASSLAINGVHMLRWQPDQQRFAVQTSIPDPNRPWRIPR